MHELKIKIDSKSAYAVLMSLLWSYNIILEFLRVLFAKIALNNYSIGYAVINILVLILIAIAFPVLKEKMRMKYLFIYIVFFLFFVVSIAFNPINSAKNYLDELEFTILCVNLPFFFFGALYDVSLFESLKKTSMLSIYAFILYILTLGGNVVHGSSYNMSFAYCLLPHVCMMLYAWKKTHRVSYLVTFAIGFILEFLLGTRGPVLLTALFYVVFVIYDIVALKNENRFTKSVVYLMVFGALIVFYEDILEWIGSIAVSMGASTRVIDALSLDRMLLSAGRDDITERIVLAIVNNRFHGYGMSADYAIAGNYAHNFALELVVSFGLVFSIIVIIGIVVLFIKALKRTDSLNKVFLLMVFCTNGFLKLFLSSSYMLEPFFFMFIGLLFNLSTRLNGKERRII